MMLARVIFFISLCLPVVGQAFYQWQGDDTEVELRGFLRGIGIAANTPNDDVLFAQDKIIGGGLFGRLMLDVQLASFSFEMHAAQSVTNQELRTGGSRFTSLVNVERSDSFHRQFAADDADLVLDRFNVHYSTDKLSFKLGRQPINLASTFYFTPNDFFAPFAAQTFFRTYKPGVDAVRVDWQWAELSQLSLMTVLNYHTDLANDTGWSNSPNWSETSYLVRASTLHETFEGAILLGKVNGDEIIGVDFQGELFDWLGVRGEGHFRFSEQKEEPRDAQFSVGLEHRFENTLTLRLEQFYQRSGASDESEYNLVSSIDSTRFYLARNYTALGASYEVSPLLLVDAVWLFNHQDSSNLFVLYSSYSLSDESELSMSLNLPIGEQPDKGMLNSEFGSYPKSLTAEYRLYF